MATIDLSKKITEPPKLTVLSYGPSGTSKTWFGATFPDPLILSDFVEGGYMTVLGMPKSLFYNKEPVIETVCSAAEMRAAIEKYSPEIGKRFKTVVVDSLTFYAESFAVEMEPKFTNGQQFWGVFGKHIGWLQTTVHAMGVNVVWLALSKDPEEGKMGGPMLQGRQKELAPARCNTLLFHKAVQEGKDKVRYEVHTKPKAGYAARVRAGILKGGHERNLTSPIEDATYTKLMAEFGWEV